MTPKINRRHRLSYLALYYAIKGEEERSEQIRRMLRTISRPKANHRILVSA